MYYYYDVIPARVLRQWTPAMLANLHYSARRAARKHTDLETEVEVLFYYLLIKCTCIDTVDKGQKMYRRRKNVTGPKKLYQGTETERR
jgi:hypothetical protein